MPRRLVKNILRIKIKNALKLIEKKGKNNITTTFVGLIIAINESARVKKIKFLLEELISNFI